MIVTLNLQRIVIYSSLAIATMILSIFWHELMHYLFLRKYVKSNIKIGFKTNEISIGKISDYKKLKPQQRYDVYFVGVLGGLIVILGLSLLFDLELLILLIPYLIGCSSDIKQMMLLHERYGDKLYAR